MRFCGFNLHKLTGGGYLLNQEDYVQDLLQKFPDIQGTAEVPCLKEEDPEPENPDPIQLRRAQALTGALQWITTRTRPDICFAVNKTAQLMSKFPAYATRYAQNIVKYLRGTKQLGLKFRPLGGSSDYGLGGELSAPRAAGLVEIYGDASFAPNNGKSQTGLATLSGHVIAWASHRQSVTSQSSAEAELYATSDGVLLLQTLEPLIQELHASPIRKLVYNDNVGCISRYSAPNGAWRTRHLRLKAKGGRELLESGYFEARHLAGKWMLADLATKALASPRHRELLHLLEMSEPSSGEMTKEIRMLHGEFSGFPQSRGSVGSKRAMGVKTVALALSILALAASKITITVENSEDGSRVMDMLLVLGASLLVMAAYALRRWCASVANKDPVEVSGKDEDEWSVIEPDTEESSQGCMSSGPQEVMESRTLASTLTQRRARATPEEDTNRAAQELHGNPGMRKVGLRSYDPAPTSGMGQEACASDRVSGVGQGTPAPSVADSGVGQGISAPGVSDSGVGQGISAPGVSDSGVGQGISAPGASVSGLGEPVAPVDEAMQDHLFCVQKEAMGGSNDKVDYREWMQAVEASEIRIHPSWKVPRVPPRALWPAKPSWGGFQAAFHQPIPVGCNRDTWYIDEARGVLVRFHGVSRIQYFDPSRTKLPDTCQASRLTGLRRTFLKYLDSANFPSEIVEDDYRQAVSRKVQGSWVGRTEFQILRSENTARSSHDSP